jgi:hypothetical protein
MKVQKTILRAVKLQEVILLVMKTQEVALRAKEKKIMWWHAAENIGIADRPLARPYGEFSERSARVRQLAAAFSSRKLACRNPTWMIR